ERSDLLSASVPEGRRHVGMEHWLPLFFDRIDTLFDYAGDAPVVIDHLADEAVGERLAEIADHYDARRTALETAKEGSVPYKPLPADELYLTQGDWNERLAARAVVRVSPFARPEGTAVIDIGGRRGRSFAPERTAGNVNIYDALIAHIDALAKAGKRVVLAAWSEGSRDRTGQVLVDHGLERLKAVADYPEAEKLADGTLALGVLGLEEGFETDRLAVIGEQDILGDRLVRPHQKRRPVDFLSDVAGLNEGDLVVHIDHGIGRFAGLKTIEAAGAPHDCLEILYAGGDRVYLPVENIELLSRYGSEESEVPLDKL
ncbi:MAG TPA: CarD family transcriptional regulator, partial [Bauldia sp.]|nr:CarD family transcriptional regulator [Bauldia sp.]